MSTPFLSLLMASALSLVHVTTPFICGTYSRVLPSSVPLVTQYTLIFVHSQTQMVGSERQNMAYSIEYPQTFVLTYIHPPT